MWAIGIVIILVILCSLGVWLWGVLSNYIQPRTATQKKDLVNIFVIIAAGVVGTFTAIAAIGNLIVSRRNLQNARATLQQQRQLDEGRAQDDALRNYFEQIGKLLAEQGLMKTKTEDDPLRLLARAQTLTVLNRLHNPSRKRDVILFLHGAGLINREKTIVNIEAANLRRADLSGDRMRNAALANAYLNGANLTNADLSYATLQEANLEGAQLRGTNLSSADLRNAKLYIAELTDADLTLADLSRAKVTEHQLNRAAFLDGATMPNGQKYEDWLKSKGSGEDGQNSGPS